ncbi:MAG: anthranilate phosphoribosyltransferase, partial [Alphaproteobacteria bacterium]
GVNMAAPIPVVEQAIANANIGFLMAPLYHPAMRYVQPIRVKLGIRTIFNLVGPMTNPASVKHMLVGCYDTKWAKPMADILKHYGVEHAWIVRGDDGMDELTTTTTTHVTELKNGVISEFIFDPQDYGIAYANLSNLIGGSPAHNGEVILDILGGMQKGAIYDIVILNAGVALYIGGKASSVADGIELAKQSIDSGKAKEALNKLIKITNDVELS